MILFALLWITYFINAAAIAPAVAWPTLLFPSVSLFNKEAILSGAVIGAAAVYQAKARTGDAIAVTGTHATVTRHTRRRTGKAFGF